MLCQIEEKLRLKTGNPLDLDYFILLYMYLIVITIVIFTHIIIATCLLSITVPRKCLKDERCVRSRISHVPKWGIPCKVLDYFILSYVYLIVIEIVIFTHWITATCSFSRSDLCKYCKYERCVRSRRSYGLKQGIPWIF